MALERVRDGITTDGAIRAIDRTWHRIERSSVGETVEQVTCNEEADVGLDDVDDRDW